jgi:hypothetical protein
LRGLLIAASQRGSSLNHGLRSFLTRRRLVLVSLLLIAFYLTFWLSWLLILAGAWLDPEVSFPKIDFFAFWAASSLALDGAASTAYDAETIWREQLRLPGDDGGYHPWRNPPIFFFVVLPLSLLPAAASLIGWSAATGGMLFTAVRRISNDRTVMLLALAFPATFWNLIIGQNGFLTAGLLAWGILLLRDRPVLAGAALGLIAVKPQFFPLVLVALVAGRHWNACVSALTCVSLASLVSIPVFGIESWEGFLSIAMMSGESIYDGGIELAKVQSASSVFLLIGMPALIAQLAQVVSTLLLAVFVALLWRSHAAMQYKAAGLALAILLATPYSYHYDLTLMGLALLWLSLQLQSEGWHAWDIEALVFAWSTPLLSLVAGPVVPIPLAPIGALALFLVLLARVDLTHNLGQVLSKPFRLET